MGYFWSSEAAFYLLVLCRKHLCREDKCSVNIHKICPSTVSQEMTRLAVSKKQVVLLSLNLFSSQKIKSRSCYTTRLSEAGHL